MAQRTMRWTWPQVRARRLERHLLTGSATDTDCAAVVTAICGAHAQVMSAAELSIALRMKGGTSTRVRQSVTDEHSLIKTFGPRGTVHLLAAVDLPMWTGALSMVPAGSGPPAGIGMTPEQTDEVVAAISTALSGDVELTVDELTPLVIEATGPWAGDLVVPAFNGHWPRWRLAIPTASHRGVLCFGTGAGESQPGHGKGRGRTMTYTRPARLVPGFRPAESAASLRTLVHRYLTAFGPASPAHVAQWLAAPRRWAIDLFDELADELTPVDLDGVTAFLPADDADPPDRRPTGLLLLPYFDSYVVGGHPRPKVFPGVASEKALSGTGQAGTLPVLLINGEVRGRWQLRRQGRRLLIRVEPFGDLTARQHAELERQVERTGTILAGPPELIIGPIDAGHHL